MKALFLAIAAFAALSLGGCNLTQAQKDAEAFHKLCSAHPELQECKDAVAQTAN